jgi:cytidyltransferase-like protein
VFNNRRVVAVAGGFDPLHIGHIRHIVSAKSLGDFLVVILARDDQLISKKGYAFMPAEERKEILENIGAVGGVILSIDPDLGCSRTLRLIKPDIFAKGGDRVPATMPVEEIDTCREIGCKITYDIGGGKIQSSSSLVSEAMSKKGASFGLLESLMISGARPF